MFNELSKIKPVQYTTAQKLTLPGILHTIIKNSKL